MFEGLYRSSGGSASLSRGMDLKTPVWPQELLAREKTMVAAGVRPPRRALSTNDYIYPTPSPSFGRSESRTVVIHQNSHNGVPSQQQQLSSAADTAPQRPPTIAEEVTIVTPPRPSVPVGRAPVRESSAARPQRPKLGAPRRSYSVMDYEPVPPTHQPSANLQLGDLPAELHYAIFDFLDPIDSTCLGLTNKHFYAIHRRMHGTVPLSARRAGPNDMEWVWHKAGRLSPPPSPPPSPPSTSRDGPPSQKGIVSAEATATATVTNTTKALALLRVRGQALCRKCGVSRCELHTHIQAWMGPGYEYCHVRDKFGPPAPEGASDSCFRSSPRDPGRCGRHRVHKSRPMSP